MCISLFLVNRSFLGLSHTRGIINKEVLGVLDRVSSLSFVMMIVVVVAS